MWLKSPMLLEALVMFLTHVGSLVGWDEEMEYEVIAVALPAVLTLMGLLSEDPTMTQQGGLKGKHISAACTLKAFCYCGYSG